MYINITHGSCCEDRPLLRDPWENSLGQTVRRGVEYCLKSRLFSLLTLGHLHVLIHEIGHAVAHIVLTGGEATINLSTVDCKGSTAYRAGKRSLSPIGATWRNLSGPLADIIFSFVLILGIFALTHYIPMSPNLSLGLRIAIGAPAALWVVGEFLYAGISAYKKDSGDFGHIFSQGGWSHLLAAIAILVGICAVSILGTVMML